MAQLMSVKLSRSDAAPWGFRLQGGKDFGSPLLIQKVNGGSPAERAGLQAGDAVIKVNAVEVFNLRHKDAQDNIVRAGNSFEITVQRGGSTWKPAVTPVGPQPVLPQSAGHITPVTKTSLAANRPAASPIGTGHNYSPAPFAQPQQQMNGNGMDPVKSIVNKQYNSPVGIYSEETIAETLSAQAEVLAGGVLGVNFKKNERNYDPANSEVFKMLNEIANEPRTPEPEPSAGMQYFSHSSHAIGGRATSPCPGTPQADRMGTPPVQRIGTLPGQRLGTPQGQKMAPSPQPAMKTLPQTAMRPLPQSAVKPLPQSCVKPLPKTGVPTPKVVTGTPQCTDCERVIVGGQKPAGAISAALANRGPMAAPAQAPASPLASNFAPMPFHAPGGFTGMKPNFNAAPPMPSMAPKPSMPSMPSKPSMPSMPCAPVPAPFTTPAKPAAAGSKFAWPPKNPPEEISTSSTATPLYIPPGPINQSASTISSLFDQSSTGISTTRKSSIQSESMLQSVTLVQPFPQPYADFITHQPVARPMSAYQYVPKALGSNDPRPRSAFAEPSKPGFKPVTSTHNVTFDQDVQFCGTSKGLEGASPCSQRKKFSVCSQEVMGITEKGTKYASLEQLAETIDTAILVSALTGRPESPVPMDHVEDAAAQPVAASFTPHDDEKELVVGLKHVIEATQQQKRSSVGQLQAVGPQRWQSPFVSALTTAPDRPYSPLPTSAAVPAETKTISPRPTTLPVSYKQLPQPTEGFVPIPQEESNPLPILFDQPQHSHFISALTIAPDRPYSPLPPPAPPLPMKPVPYPEQSEPYQPRSEACVSPMVSALTVAPQRPYSPFTVTKAPTSVLDSVQVMQANINLGEPFNLPTPSQYSSMVSALTIAPERPYTPLCVTQAVSMTTEAKPVDAHPDTSFNIVPPKICSDLQGAVYKPKAVIGTSENVQCQDAAKPQDPKAVLPVSDKLEQSVQDIPAKTPVVQVTESATTPSQDIRKTPQQKQKAQKTPEKKTTLQKAVKIQSEPKVIAETPDQHKNALNLHRPTQQRPITPNIPRTPTPSMITGLMKPAAIPYYQQNIGDGDFPCRSPRPVTPTLICPMTVPRPVTPMPHKQLGVVRSLTPVARSPAKPAAQSRNVDVSDSHLQQNIESQNSPQVVVTRKTHVTEEFESFHKESTQIIETSGDTKKCISHNEQTSAIAQQSDMLNREVMAITNGNVTRRESSTLQSSQVAAQSQQITYDSQHNTQHADSIQHIEAPKPKEALTVQDIPQGAFISLEESQRASPLPFPNISLPEGMTYDVVDNKAMYTTGKNKQVFKLNQTQQMGPTKETSSQFKIQAPTHKDPFISLMAPKFEPKVIVSDPSISSALSQAPLTLNSNPAPLQPLGQTKFQPLAPQPVPAVSKPIQAPTATIPVNVMAGSQFAHNFQPVVTQGTNSFTPKSSGNGFQSFNPKVVSFQPSPCPAPNDGTSRRGSGSLNVAPAVPASLGVAPSRGSASRSSQDVIPAIRAPGLMDPCKSPPNAGGGSGPKGASFAGSSAPVRGRGVLNQAMAPGARQATCGQCQSQVRGPFVTALGKIWCPEHFVCVNAQCKRQLADIGFVEEKGQLYCEYCFEQYIAPACTKCSGKIKGDCLNAIGKSYHPECFVCCYCNKLFGNNPFFLEDGMPYCQADWNELFTTKCFACGFPIEAGDRWVEALNNNYHSQCFNCTSCKKNLEGQSFFAKSGRPFCKAHAR